MASSRLFTAANNAGIILVVFQMLYRKINPKKIDKNTAINVFVMC